MDTDEIVAKIARHVRGREDIVAVYLYGSHAGGAARPRSDIDVAVLFTPAVTDTLRAQLDLDVELSKIPGLSRVEVAALNHAPLRLRAEVLRTGLRVFCRDDEARTAFEFDTMRRWWDMLPWHAAYDREYFAAVKENFTDEQRRAYQRARQTSPAAG